MDSSISALPNVVPVPVKTEAGTAEGAEKQTRQLRKACADFEAIFVYTMLKTMRATIPRSGLTDGFAGKDTYTMIMDQKVAEELTRRGDGIGLQKMLMEQLQPKRDTAGEPRDTVSTVTVK